MRINDSEEGTVDMDMLEENLKVIRGYVALGSTGLLMLESAKTEHVVGFCSKSKKLKFIKARHDVSHFHNSFHCFLVFSLWKPLFVPRS